jgi:hypothetical protein
LLRADTRGKKLKKTFDRFFAAKRTASRQKTDQIELSCPYGVRLAEIFGPNCPHFAGRRRAAPNEACYK